MHLDKDSGNLYPVQTKGGGNSDIALCDVRLWTSMSITHLRYKTYYIRDRQGDIRPIIVNACVVPGLKYNLLSVRGLTKAVYAVHHHLDPGELGIYAAVINKNIDNLISIREFSPQNDTFIPPFQIAPFGTSNLTFS